MFIELERYNYTEEKEEYIIIRRSDIKAVKKLHNGEAEVYTEDLGWLAVCDSYHELKDELMGNKSVPLFNRSE